MRLVRLCEILETVAAAVERQREIAERASKNGHVQTATPPGRGVAAEDRPRGSGAATMAA